MDFLRLLRVGFYNRATRSNFFAILRFFYCHTEALAEVSQNKISKVIQKKTEIFRSLHSLNMTRKFICHCERGQSSSVAKRSFFRKQGKAEVSLVKQGKAEVSLVIYFSLSLRDLRSKSWQSHKNC